MKEEMEEMEEMEEIDWDRLGCLAILSEEFTGTSDSSINEIGEELKFLYEILKLKCKLSEGDIDKHTYAERLLDLM